MNLNPNKQPDEYDDGSQGSIEPSENSLTAQTRHNEDFRPHQNLKDSLPGSEAERGIPQDLSVRKISTMQKVGMLVVGIFGVGLVVAGVARYGQDWFKKEPKPEQFQTASEGGQKHDFGRSQREVLDEKANEMPEVVAASEPEEKKEPETMPQEETPENAPAPAVVEPPPDLRLTSPLTFDKDGGTADRLAAGGADGSAALTQASPYPTAFPDGDSSLGGAGGQSQQKGLAGRLNASVFTPGSAALRGNMDFLLGRTTGISCSLMTRIVTTYPGITKCQVMNDVYSANGKVLLVEKGSVIHGEQQSALTHGQARIFVAWTTIETPNGVSVSIDSLGADPLGGSGHPARINSHFWQRIGGAVMISMVDDTINAYGRRSSNKGSSNNVSFESTTEAAQDIATEVLKNSINIPPTGYVNQGERIMVYVARDVDFSNVYELVHTD